MKSGNIGLLACYEFSPSHAFLSARFQWPTPSLIGGALLSPEEQEQPPDYWPTKPRPPRPFYASPQGRFLVLAT